MSFGLRWSRSCRPPRASAVVAGVITVRFSKRSHGGSARAVRGAICPRTWCRGRRPGNGTAAGRSTAHTPRFSLPCNGNTVSMPAIWMPVCRNCCRSTRPACAHISTRPVPEPIRTQGAESNDKDLPTEPADHALGRSRGGRTTKIHALTDQDCCPVTMLLTPGQAGDNPQLAPLLDVHDADRQADGTGKDTFRLLADKAYSHPSTSTEAARPADPTHHPGTNRPAETPQRQGISRRPAPLVRPHDLRRTQHHRTRLRPPQAMARHRHPLRQVRPHLPRRRPARRITPAHPQQAIEKHALELQG
jgi:transposase